MSTGAAISGTEVTADDNNKFVGVSLQEFLKSCNDGFESNNFDAVKTGITIANSIMDEFVTTRFSIVVQGQRPMVDALDMFTMMQVLAKSLKHHRALLAVVIPLLGLITMWVGFTLMDWGIEMRLSMKWIS